MTTFCLFFYNTPVISHLGSFSNPFTFVFAIIGINFIVEFITNGIVGGGCVLGIKKAADKIGLISPLPHFFVRKEEKAEAK